MRKAPTERPAFLIRILDRQNDTWQGELTWINSGEKAPFRSMLELVRLIDSALAESPLPSGEAAEKE